MIEGIFQPTHLIFIVIIALIVLGPSKLGDVGGALGRSVREFKENTEGPTASTATARLETGNAFSAGTIVQGSTTPTTSSAEAIHATDV